MNEKLKKRAGMYIKDEKYYPSVTQILKVIDKPALRYWYGKQVYEATALNPELSEQEALAYPYKVSESAKDRGTAVHDIVEAYKNIGDVVGQEGPFQEYAKAFQDFVNEYDIEVVENEKTVYSEKYRYAGTLDLLVKIKGKLTIIDVKTGKDIYPEAHLQVSAYKQALSEDGIEVEDTAILLLQDDGKYKYEKAKDKFQGFLACKFIWESLNEELLKKAGVPISERLL